MANKKLRDSFIFLSPRLTIQTSHLNKRDVRKIKIALCMKMGVAALLVAIGIFLLNSVLFLVLGFESGWRHVETYGAASLAGEIVSIVGALMVIVSEIIGLTSKKALVKEKFIIFGNNFLYLVVGAQMFLSLYADASQGFLSTTPTLSAAIVLISILIIIQPGFWSMAIVLDTLTSLALVFEALYCYFTFDMQSLYYYLFVAFAFPFACYLMMTIMFYAESQKYCQELRNEVLYNTALYDELTHCKNRYALREYLKENKKRWADKEVELLLIMFDIDNFKLYNDQFSHPGGDYCLSSIAEAIRKTFPSPSLDFYRYGGEEFLLFFELEYDDKAMEIMEQVRKTVKNLKIIAPDGAPNDMVTISVGGTVIKNMQTFDFEKELAIVDKNLYQAKNSGKDVCVLDGNIVN